NPGHKECVSNVVLNKTLLQIKMMRTLCVNPSFGTQVNNNHSHLGLQVLLRTFSQFTHLFH
ncbi:hypothetical protein ACS8FA_15645, partial [Psychrobacter sp. 1Y1]|uniref:hypothetical protein n=1 Tax=Psychrobacter sp. 1Y1 TaxID=3453574 RepID=UPI003F457C5B